MRNSTWVPIIYRHSELTIVINVDNNDLSLLVHPIYVRDGVEGSTEPIIILSSSPVKPHRPSRDHSHTSPSESSTEGLSLGDLESNPVSNSRGGYHRLNPDYM